MSISRRMFLHAGTLAIVSAGVPLKGLAAEAFNQSGSGTSLSGRNQTNALQRLNKEAFARHLNTKFWLRQRNSAATPVKLIELGDMWHTAKSARTECFAAVFLGSLETPLPQNTYSVQHESMGKFEMFVVPVGKSKQGIYYEAVFNRLI